MSCAVIFGGTGFIGTFFARHLIEKEGFEKVYLYDHEPASLKTSATDRVGTLGIDNACRKFCCRSSRARS
jgi:nucleoside-diphosphate-sugar epimerase